MTYGVLVVVALAMVAVFLWPEAVPAHVLGRGRRRGAAGPGTGARSRRRWRRSGPDPGDVEAALAELLALVAAPLRVGAPPVSSVAAASRAVVDDPVVGELTRRLVDAARAAEDVSAVWRAYAPGAEAAFVARAWALSERTGAPLADALDAAEQVLRARRRTRQRLAAAAAGPRASMMVLVLLPLSGPLVGLACGISPRELYLQSPLAVASLVLGLVLALAAWTWSRAILARAAA